jgi:hypothetical protein
MTYNTHYELNGVYKENKDSGLEANAEKTKYIFLSHEQKVGQNHTIRHIN